MTADAAVTEVVTSEGNKIRQRLGRVGAIVTRRRGKVRAASSPVSASPTAYRTLSRKLAPSLVSIGGALAVAGALGAWIRVSSVKTEGLAEEQVRAVMGYEADWGRVIAVVAALTAISAVAWLRRGLVFKLASIALSLAVIALATWRLSIISESAAGLVLEARTDPIDFVSLHAGFGWGAWLLVVADVVLFLGVSAGLLRELDVRKGIVG